jgi:hypothetical protein
MNFHRRVVLSMALENKLLPTKFSFTTLFFYSKGIRFIKGVL